MGDFFQFLMKHGYSVVFGWVLAEQLGIPVPAAPVLLAAGALVALGKMNLLLAAGLALAASVCADLLWYEIGRRRGSRVLTFLCKISLEPDSCVKNTENAFARNGARSLVLAKLVPGLGTVAPPLAGIMGMRLGRFLFFDACGALLWIGLFMGLGMIFSNQLELVLELASQLGEKFGLLLGGTLAAYIGWKYIQRQLFIRHLRSARITPQQLKEKLDAGENVIVVDLRHTAALQYDPDTIPGARHVDPDELDEKNDLIPPDREVILFCT